MSYRRTLTVKTGFLSAVTVVVIEDDEDASVTLAEPVTINGHTITECSARDPDNECALVRVARRNFAFGLLRRAGYDYDRADRFASARDYRY